MAAIHLTLGLIAVTGVASTLAFICDDVDPVACQGLSGQQDVCTDALAINICPRFCKLCPLECYHCDSPVSSFADCKTTKQCAANQTCMLKTLRSSVDGHLEYEMTCEAAQVCDGPGLQSPFGKRDLSESRKARDLTVTCCSTDLCNTPEPQTTAAMMTTTTTMKTTISSVTATDCARDIEFLIDDSVSVSHLEFGASIDFVESLIRRLVIGANASMVGIATFDSRVHNKWDLDHYHTQAELLQALQRVDSSGGHTDADEALKFAVQHAFQRRNGDRPGFPDVLVLITDGPGHQNSLRTLIHDAHEVDKLSKDVIAVGVGSLFGGDFELSHIATDSEHKIAVSAYRFLQSSALQDKVFNLICHDHQQ